MSTPTSDAAQIPGPAATIRPASRRRNLIAAELPGRGVATVRGAAEARRREGASRTPSLGARAPVQQAGTVAMSLTDGEDQTCRLLVRARRQRQGKKKDQPYPNPKVQD